MARKKLAPAKEYENRDINDWNAVTFRAYMFDLHEKKLGIPYVSNNIAIENTNIKRLCDQYGKETTKHFIDICFDEYRPSPKYRGLSFMFMYTYMRERNLTKAIAKQQAAERQAVKDEQQLDIDKAKEWF